MLRSRGLAIVILALGLAATGFAWWRERILAQRNHTIEMQDGLVRLNPLLMPPLTSRFQSIQDALNATLRRDGPSQQAWESFIQVTEWRQRFQGMIEMGYAEPVTNTSGETSYIVKFLDTSISQPVHVPGFDLTKNPVIREGIINTAD